MFYIQSTSKSVVAIKAMPDPADEIVYIVLAQHVLPQTVKSAVVGGFVTTLPANKIALCFPVLIYRTRSVKELRGSKLAPRSLKVKLDGLFAGDFSFQRARIPAKILCESEQLGVIHRSVANPQYPGWGGHRCPKLRRKTSLWPEKI